MLAGTAGADRAEMCSGSQFIREHCTLTVATAVVGGAGPILGVRHHDHHWLRLLTRMKGEYNTSPDESRPSGRFIPAETPVQNGTAVIMAPAEP